MTTWPLRRTHRTVVERIRLREGLELTECVRAMSLIVDYNRREKINAEDAEGAKRKKQHLYAIDCSHLSVLSVLEL
jgi:hypothetical protein